MEGHMGTLVCNEPRSGLLLYRNYHVEYACVVVVWYYVLQIYDG